MNPFEAISLKPFFILVFVVALIIGATGAAIYFGNHPSTTADEAQFQNFLREHKCEWVMSIPPQTSTRDPNQFGGQPGPAILPQKRLGRDIYRCADGATVVRDRK